MSSANEQILLFEIMATELQERAVSDSITAEHARNAAMLLLSQFCVNFYTLTSNV